MVKTTVPMWDEGGHVILYNITITGNKENIDKINRALEQVKFIADKKGDRSASAFIRQHFDAEIEQVIR